MSYYRQGSTLLLNQSFAFNFVCENFQPKLINCYSNYQWIFIFYSVAWLTTGMSQMRLYEYMFQMWRIDPYALCIRTFN
jgi:hypothetical protein